MSTKLASLLHDLANRMEQIALVHLYEARFDAALNLLSDQVLDSLKDENLLKEWGICKIDGRESCATRDTVITTQHNMMKR